MEGFYRTLIKTTYGENPTKTKTGKCWKIVKLMVRVFIIDIRKARVGAEKAYVASYSHMRVVQYLWNTTQSYRVITEFR